MKVDDRSAIVEHLIYQLWEHDYFATIPLRTIDGHDITIISTGIKNEDAGPDFKDIAIKLEDKIYHGDLEIHRAPEDWYQHCHHADPAYNNVIMHLVIGPARLDEPAIKLNRHPVIAQVFVDLSDEQFSYITKSLQSSISKIIPESICTLKGKNEAFKLVAIDYFSGLRFQDKADRFTEQRQTSSWNQILYIGIMEALGYSKNQVPFRKLAQLFPFEALVLEFRNTADEEVLVQLLGVLFGLSGLLPSQNSYFDWRKIKDQETQDYIPQLEEAWRQFSDRLGIIPLRREEWQFFRLRPSNFPTRRLAGVCLILRQFVKEGILITILRTIRGLYANPQLLIKEMENFFISKTAGYWSTHYQLDEKPPELINERSVTLVGKERARDIVINVILPLMLAYGSEIEDAQLKTRILQIYQAYPKISSNSIIKVMSQKLFGEEKKATKFINTAARQQGLIHLYKLYCHRGECDRCEKEWTKQLR